MATAFSVAAVRAARTRICRNTAPPPSRGSTASHVITIRRPPAAQQPRLGAYDDPRTTAISTTLSRAIMRRLLSRNG